MFHFIFYSQALYGKNPDPSVIFFPAKSGEGLIAVCCFLYSSKYVTM